MTQYATIVFDCDGVVLDSNRVKTDAFRTVGERYGGDHAEELVRYHCANGGVSRYLKFQHFVEEILRRRPDQQLVDSLVDSFAAEVKAKLRLCPVTPGLSEVRETLADCRWAIASGGDQDELREVFAERGIDHWFDGGIFGSPTPKEQILLQQIDASAWPGPIIMLGDSRYDHIAAEAAGLDFLFVSAWSEFEDWRSYCSARKLPFVSTVAELPRFLETNGSST